MVDVKCSLVSLIMSGEMTVSIRWTDPLLQAVVGYKTMGAQKWRLCSLHEGPEGFLRVSLKGRVLRACLIGSPQKEDEWRLPGLGGVLPEAEREPDALKVLHQHLGPLKLDRGITTPSFLLISRGENEGSAKARAEISQMGPLTRNLRQT